MGAKNIVLYTIVDPRQYVGVELPLIAGVGKPQRAFVEMARYLGWDQWVWALMDLRDFENDWMHIRDLGNENLWTLSVPAQEVKWCRLSAYCEHRGAVRDWFYKNPQSIAGIGDKPLGLIRVPVIPIRILQKRSAGEVFQEAGLQTDDQKT
jgi:hypothetical protein